MALLTPGSRKFIEACITHGKKGDNLSSEEGEDLEHPSIVHFATYSLDPCNLEALLKTKPNMNEKFRGGTPLHWIVFELTEENECVMRVCIELLFKYGASPNITDFREFTPLEVLLARVQARKKKNLVQLFLSQPDLDIDSYRNGEVRRLLQLQFPDLTLPEERQKLEINKERLLISVTWGDVPLFEQQFAEYMQSPKNEKGKQVDDLQETLYELTKRAIEQGNCEVVELLLNEPNLQLTSDYRCSLMQSAINALFSSHNNQKCFDLLFNFQCVDINESNASHEVPLSFAGKSGNTWAMRKLLEHGAYIGSKISSETLPIKDIPPEILKEHFDSCITYKGQPSDPDFEIIIDYKNLIPYRTQEGRASVSLKQKDPPPAYRDTIKGEPCDRDIEGSIDDKNPISPVFFNEMAPFAFMAKSTEMVNLLQHPLISSFLHLKWRRLSMIFYLDLLIFFLFSVSMFAYTLLKLHASEHTEFLSFSRASSWVGIGYLIIRESFQFMIASIQEWRLSNIIEWTLIVLSIFTCIELDLDKETQRVLATLNILLVVMVFCLLVGSQPVLCISTHMFKLHEISNNFVKSFSLYTIFLLTLSLCSYMIFGNVTSEPGSANEKDDLIDLSDPISSLINTILNHLNNRNITFASSNHYLIFLLFVIFMTVVIFTLLHGLVVNNTQEIKTQADLEGIISHTLLMSRYEQVLTAPFFRSIHVLQTICKRWVSIRHNQISIQPNHGNKVFPSMPILPCCCPVLIGKCSEMNDRTVKMAQAVISKQIRAKQEVVQNEVRQKQMRQEINYKTNMWKRGRMLENSVTKIMDNKKPRRQEIKEEQLRNGIDMIGCRLKYMEHQLDQLLKGGLISNKK
ncbi:transient receptor potential cation channel protein painless-like [Drosophila rhopaloa]|uniref:Transient receptor potential cation channel protein painless n=1 Tax=Drosophila rhopaloa TaxID=1041015 RepID=A0ABM5J4Q9_DRORH|nr:transient receptor potential cation channel protein painless-like [Drosophila rhopaloa]